MCICMCGSSNPHPHDVCFKPGFAKTYKSKGRPQQKQRKRAAALDVAVVRCTRAVLISLMLIVIVARIITSSTVMFLPAACRLFPFISFPGGAGSSSGSGHHQGSPAGSSTSRPTKKRSRYDKHKQDKKRKRTNEDKMVRQARTPQTKHCPLPSHMQGSFLRVGTWNLNGLYRCTKASSARTSATARLDTIIIELQRLHALGKTMHVIAIQETWLGRGDRPRAISGYRWELKPRKEYVASNRDKGGGLALAPCA